MAHTQFRCPWDFRCRRWLCSPRTTARSTSPRSDSRPGERSRCPGCSFPAPTTATTGLYWPENRLGSSHRNCNIDGRNVTVLKTKKLSWCWQIRAMLLEVSPPATYDFQLTLHSNHVPISYRFRNKRWFQSKIAKKNFPPPCILRLRWRGSHWHWYRGLGSKN